MYSKQEAAQLREAFWTALGQYLAPILSAEGEKINWINYKTGQKPVTFRLEADAHGAGIAIVIQHKDDAVRQRYYEQFVSLRSLLQEALEEEWSWEAETQDGSSRSCSRIGTALHGISLYKKEDWPQLISFFKPRLLALDAFWSDVKYSFETLSLQG